MNFAKVDKGVGDGLNAYPQKVDNCRFLVVGVLTRNVLCIFIRLPSWRVRQCRSGNKPDATNAIID